MTPAYSGGRKNFDLGRVGEVLGRVGTRFVRVLIAHVGLAGAIGRETAEAARAGGGAERMIRQSRGMTRETAWPDIMEPKGEVAERGCSNEVERQRG